MVRISATGDIVQDDAPKNEPNPRQRQNQGFIRTDEARDEQPNQQGMYGSVSVFDSLNQKLLDQGIPRWNAGPYVVEPIVSVGFLLAALLIGWHGLLFAALLFFVAKYSASQGHNPFAGQSHRSHRRRGGGGQRGGGGGQRLGRS